MSERPGALTQEFAPEVDLPQAEAPVRERPSRGITRSSVGWFVAGAVLIIWCIWAFIDDSTLFVALLGAGLAKGAIVSLAAIGFLMIMKATGIANFAQGDLITLGAFLDVLGHGSNRAREGRARRSRSASGISLTLVLMFVLGVVIERVAYAPAPSGP